MSLCDLVFVLLYWPVAMLAACLGSAWRWIRDSIR